MYYEKLLPIIYSRFFGILGIARKITALGVGLFRPMMRQVSEADMRVVVHKSCGLVAQTFMLAMAEQGYDTCPLEGFDSLRVKKTAQTALWCRNQYGRNLWNPRRKGRLGR